MNNKFSPGDKVVTFSPGAYPEIHSKVYLVQSFWITGGEYVYRIESINGDYGDCLIVNEKYIFAAPAKNATVSYKIQYDTLNRWKVYRTDETIVIPQKEIAFFSAEKDAREYANWKNSAGN